MIAFMIFIGAVMVAIPLWGIWIVFIRVEETMEATFKELITKG